MFLAKCFDFKIFQDLIDILFFSFWCIRLVCVYGVQRSVSVNLGEFFLLGLIEDGSPCANHSVAFFRECSFLSRVCSSVSTSPCIFVKKNCSSCTTSEEDVVTSMNVVCTSCRILRQI